MRLSLLLIPILTIAIALSLSISNVNAIVVNNTDFSINVPDNWVYQDSTTYSPLMGESGDDAWINLFPNELSGVFIHTDLENWTEVIQAIQNEGVYSNFGSDVFFPYRNVPVESYAQYYINLMSPVKVFSRENTTIDGEAAVKIHRTETGNVTNVEVVEYLTVHKGKPYYILYVANVKDLQKYLPQFEQMVKTFKFMK